MMAAITNNTPNVNIMVAQMLAPTAPAAALINEADDNAMHPPDLEVDSAAELPVNTATTPINAGQTPGESLNTVNAAARLLPELELVDLTTDSLDSDIALNMAIQESGELQNVIDRASEMIEESRWLINYMAESPPGSGASAAQNSTTTLEDISNEPLLYYESSLEAENRSPAGHSNLLKFLGLKSKDANYSEKPSHSANDDHPYFETMPKEMSSARAQPFTPATKANEIETSQALKPLSIVIPPSTSSRRRRSRRNDFDSPVEGPTWCGMCRYTSATGTCEHGYRVNYPSASHRASSPHAATASTSQAQALDLTKKGAKKRKDDPPTTIYSRTVRGPATRHMPMPSEEDEYAAGPSTKYRDSEGVMRFYSDGSKCPGEEPKKTGSSVKSICGKRTYSSRAGPSGYSQRSAAPAPRCRTPEPPCYAVPDSTTVPGGSDEMDFTGEYDNFINIFSDAYPDPDMNTEDNNNYPDPDMYPEDNNNNNNE